MTGEWMSSRAKRGICGPSRQSHRFLVAALLGMTRVGVIPSEARDLWPSRPQWELRPHLRQDRRDPLLLIRVLRHALRLAVVLGGELLVALLFVRLAEAVVRVPALRVVLHVLAEHLDRLVGLTRAEELVSVSVDLGLGRDFHRL